jgi:glycosyltransferase involved in cell wall biosynthesis
MKVAYFSPLPPDRSGIADYSALLLPALEQRIEVEVVRPGRTRPLAATDVALYHVGNNPDAHGWIVDALRRRPGVVVLHDFVLHHLVAGLTIGRKDGHAYLAAMEREAGVPGRLLGYGVLEGRVPPLWEVRPEEFPLAGEVVDRALGLIVHSRYVEAHVREAGYEGTLWVVPHPAWPVPDLRRAQVEGEPVFGCFGHLNESKRIPQLLEAFAAVRAEHPHARLLLVGPSSPAFDLNARLASAGVTRDGVVREEYVEEQRLWELMAACDVVVALRAPTMGETSGTVVRALSLGKPLVVSDLGWFAELPDELALKVPARVDGEVPALAGALLGLAADERRRAEMGRAAREHAEREHDLDAAADRYVAALEYAAGSTEVEKRVLEEVASAAADVGVDAALIAPALAESGLVTNGAVASGRVPGTVTRTRPVRAWPRWSRPLARVPIWAWLGAIVAVSSVVQILLARRLVAPWIMVDELVYSDMARSFADTGDFLIRGVHANYGVVYPALLAIPYGLFGPMPDVYAAAKSMNAVLISTAAIPAYLLARRVLSQWTALVAAVFAVVLPSLAYAGTVMTENAFYPLFLWLVLALVGMLERPTARRQLLVLGLCGLAFLTRPQAVALVVAALAAPLLLAWIERGRPRRLTVYAPLFGATLIVALAVIISEIVRGRSPAAALGNYSVTGSAGYEPWPAFKWLVYHVAELDLALFVLPFAAAFVVAASARHLDRPLRVFTAASASIVAWLVLEVAVFASHYSERVEERNLFYVMPLFLIALLAWIERGQPRPPRATVVAAVLAAALPGALPLFRLVGNGNVSALSDTIGLQPWWYLNDRVVGAEAITLVVVLVAIGLGVTFLFLSRRYASWLPVLVALGFLLTWLPVELWAKGFPSASVGALYQGVGTGHDRDWVDAAVGRGANVALLASTTRNPFAVQESEFWNRSVRRLYNLSGHEFGGGMPEQAAEANARTGVVKSGGKPLDAGYVLTDAATAVAGRVVARNDDLAGGEGMRLVLYRVDKPVRLTRRIIGRYDDGWSGPALEWINTQCVGGSLALDLETDFTTFPNGQSVHVTGTTQPRTLRLTRLTSPLTTSLPLRPVNGVCRVRFVSSPAQRPPNGDPRILGARFRSIVYQPPKR